MALRRRLQSLRRLRKRQHGGRHRYIDQPGDREYSNWTDASGASVCAKCGSRWIGQRKPFGTSSSGGYCALTLAGRRYGIAEGECFGSGELSWLARSYPDCGGWLSALVAVSSLFGGTRPRAFWEIGATGHPEDQSRRSRHRSNRWSAKEPLRWYCDGCSHGITKIPGRDRTQRSVASYLAAN